MMMMFVSFSPNFYILDEPTNHLDMETIEALAKALNKFKVGVFVPTYLLSLRCVPHLYDVACSRAESSWYRMTSV